LASFTGIPTSLYQEVEYRKVGWGDPAYVHDEERGPFRFRDGRFAFSRQHADRTSQETGKVGDKGSAWLRGALRRGWTVSWH
jgi:hypothetical protein